MITFGVTHGLGSFTYTMGVCEETWYMLGRGVAFPKLLQLVCFSQCLAWLWGVLEHLTMYVGGEQVAERFYVALRSGR